MECFYAFSGGGLHFPTFENMRLARGSKQAPQEKATVRTSTVAECREQDSLSKFGPELPLVKNAVAPGFNNSVVRPAALKLNG
jgi:hypothetical protein